jgi:DNA-binding MarR family transcriptional regulator
VTHPTRALSEVVHQRHRLGVLTIACEVEQVEFGYLKDALDLTAGNLSRHLAVLAEARLVEIEKGYAGKRPRTWVRITPEGRTAVAAELRALRSLVALESVVRGAEDAATGAAEKPRRAPGGPAPAPA